ncbi:MAG: FG-GAP-like repeat-containing protein [Myxococcota bacterium]
MTASPRSSRRWFALALLAATLAGCLRSVIAGDAEGDGGAFDAGARDAGPGDLGADAVFAADGARPDGAASDLARDLGPPPAPPTLRAPALGTMTGSPFATDRAEDAPLRPWVSWLPAPGATGYRVQFAACTAGPWERCAFDGAVVDARVPGEPSPAGEALRFRPASALPVARTPPIGRRYVWRVAACHGGGCGPFSAPRYLLVGRLRQDFDGDGYGDLAVGAPDQSEAGPGAAGAVYVYRGGPEGLASTPAVVLSSPRPASLGGFGLSVAALGDVNGDGFGDLAVGATGEALGRLRVGRAYVALGGPDGLGGTLTTLEAPRALRGGRFGTVGAPGDVDGDGRADLLVRDDEGEVLLYLGEAAGIATSPSVTLRDPADDGEPGFGAAVGGPGDVDGDGFPDVAVGDFEVFVGEGRVRVYPGGAAGVDASASRLLEDDAAMRERAQYGFVIAGGDLDGDGLADVLVGSPGSDGAERQPGRLLLHPGSPDGASPAPATSRQARRFFDIDRFGEAIAAPGDMNGDGRLDVFVGLGLARSDEAAFVFLGTEEGLPETPLELRLPRPGSGGPPSPVSTLDANGDGFTDLAVGSPLESGRVFVFYGGRDAPSATPSLALDNPRTDAGATSFGRSLAQ